MIPLKTPLESWDRIYLLQAKETSEWMWDFLRMWHRGHCGGGAGNLESLIPSICLCLAREDFLQDVGGFLVGGCMHA